MTVAVAPAALERTSRPAPAAVVAARPSATDTLAANSARVLAIPAGFPEAQLMVMPDRYVNEPLPASFRIPLTIRGRSGIASADPPSAIIWTEGGSSYLLTSRLLSIPQLVDLASSLQ